MSDRETIEWCNGLFVGQLTPDEMGAFNRLCHSGEAQRSYEGVGGVMGMAKVKLHPSLIAFRDNQYGSGR